MASYLTQIKSRANTLVIRPVVPLDQFDRSVMEEAKKVILGTSEEFHFDAQGKLIHHNPPDEKASILFDENKRKQLDQKSEKEHDEAYKEADEIDFQTIELSPHARDVVFAVTALLLSKDRSDPGIVGVDEAPCDLSAGQAVTRQVYQIHSNPYMRFIVEYESPVREHIQMVERMRAMGTDDLWTTAQHKQSMSMDIDAEEVWGTLAESDKEELQAYHSMREAEAMGALERGLTEIIKEPTQEELDDMDSVEFSEHEIYTPERMAEHRHRQAKGLLLDNRAVWSTAPLFRFHNSFPEAVKYLLEVEAEDFHLDPNGKVERINNIPTFLEQYKDRPLGHLELNATPALLEALRAELRGSAIAHS